MFKINLVPEVKQEQIRIRKINVITTTVAIVSAVAIGAVALILLSYILGRTAQLSLIEKDTKKINNELEAYKDLETTVISLEEGLREINQIISGGPKWSKFLGELEKVTPADIQIKNFAIEGNKISLDLEGKDIRTIDRLVKSFSNYKVDDKNLFTNVTVDGYSQSGNTVSFKATMDLVSGVLW